MHRCRGHRDLSSVAATSSDVADFTVYACGNRTTRKERKRGRKGGRKVDSRSPSPPPLSFRRSSGKCVPNLSCVALSEGNIFSHDCPPGGVLGRGMPFSAPSFPVFIVASTFKELPAAHYGSRCVNLAALLEVMKSSCTPYPGRPMIRTNLAQGLQSYFSLCSNFKYG